MRVKLGELGEIITGNTPKTSDANNYASNDIMFVKPSDISENTVTLLSKSEYYISEYARRKARILPVGSILVSCIGTVGKIAINTTECAFNQQINAIVPNTGKCYTKYVAYALQAIKPQLQAMANAAVVPILNKAQFSEIEIILPTIEEQHRIAAVLDKVTDLIAKRQAQLDKLDELVKSRFVEMFGEPGTDQKGGGMVCLGSLCIINPKKSQEKRLSSDLRVSFIPMTAVTENGGIDVSETKTYNEVKTGFTYFAEKDVLFAKITPCMENGKGAIAQRLCNGIGFGSTEFHVLRPIPGQSNPYWIYSLTSFPQFRQDAASNMTGSAGQRRVPASFLETYKVSAPPIALQDQFALFVKQIQRMKAKAHNSLEKLDVLKNSLMQQYFG